MMKIRFVFVFLAVAVFVSCASAWDFYGYAYDVNGNALNNTLVNITIWTMSGGPPSAVGSNASTSDAEGWFNFSVSEDSDWMYKPVVTSFNSTNGAIDLIGPSLPQFPAREFINTTDINFYLKPAGTINVTAINSTGNRITFRYQVKDTRLGYSIANQFTSAVSEEIVYVPRDRNYSVMVYPDQAMPISFNWNNFSSVSSYNIVAGLSTYNVTTHTVQKTFNASDSLIRVTGYILNTTGDDFADWNEFTVVPFLLEPGDMVYLGDNAGMPYNMSAWSGQSDIYNLTSGFYNITLPGPAESATYILFATARNGSKYYGGYRNITLSYSDSSTELNFTLYSLMSTSWGTANGNLSLNDAVSWAKVNISSAKQGFNLVNSTGSIISNLNAHLETKVDYTDYGAMQFTFMTDVSSGNASFYLPLLNASVKEMNIFSQMYSPKRVGTRTAAQILNNSNITMTTFSPGDIEGNLQGSNIFISMYISNSTCDLPVPSDSCKIGAFGPDESQGRDSFSPLSAVMGGGRLNFRMGYGDIEVVYINVDMLASGPPDASFDDSATTSTSGGFDSAMRFGSNGPTIYDYVMISMPYTQGSSTTTGLNEDADVNMTLPILYDENWNPIWNSSVNGTNGTALAGNNTHYSTYSSEWGILMGQNNCTRNQSAMNSSAPCYIDTTNNRIWIRLPHFSGTQPSVTGTVVTASASSSSSSSGGSGGGSLVSQWVKEIKLNDSGMNLGQTLKQMKQNYRAIFNVKGIGHSVGILNMTNTTITIEVASTPQTATLSIGETKKFNLDSDGYYDLSVKLTSISNGEADISIQTVNESISGTSTSTDVAVGDSFASGTGSDSEESSGENGSKLTWWILLPIVVVGAIVFFLLRKKK